MWVTPVVDTFRAALLSVYRERPCQVLPNALWKTLAEIPYYTCTFSADGDRVIHLQMLRDDALLLYWQRDRRPPHFPDMLWSNLRLALLHADFFDAGTLNPVPGAQFSSCEAYFRLRHDLSSASEAVLPPGFRFVDVCIESEASAVAGFLAQCYEDVALSAADVRGWSQLPVYAPDLTFWIVDAVRDRPVALGVSHFDALVPEVSLEWIQVHPHYRRRGLGAALVQETQARAHGRAAFATVSGAAHNATNPEALYRRCGFSGSDMWFVLRVDSLR